MPKGKSRGKIFFFGDNPPKILFPSSALPSHYLVCESVFVLFLFFDDEVEKVVFVLQTLHASLEQHYISVECGLSWEGWDKRRWLQFLAV